jgi:hypothetical protein
MIATAVTPPTVPRTMPILVPMPIELLLGAVEEAAGSLSVVGVEEIETD